MMISISVAALIGDLYCYFIMHRSSLKSASTMLGLLILTSYQFTQTGNTPVNILALGDCELTVVAVGGGGYADIGGGGSWLVACSLSVLSLETSETIITAQSGGTLGEELELYGMMMVATGAMTEVTEIVVITGAGQVLGWISPPSLWSTLVSALGLEDMEPMGAEGETF